AQHPGHRVIQRFLGLTDWQSSASRSPHAPKGSARVRRKKVLSCLTTIVLFSSLIPVLLTIRPGTPPDRHTPAVASR
ncbi:hypothetical protein, partial [Streptomyces sp. NPDC059786]|uniref:hypothetical protein n=1 Tax=Streptomyces sp. NPDC059786 TaxID=3346946 RepID=UPI00364FE843